MKLAVVGQIDGIATIAGADRIQQALVDCGDAGLWSGVVTKDIAVGQLVTVFLQDAVLPPDERWSFMERNGWRVRMARFKGVPSECLILSLGLETDLAPGTDLTEMLGVTKHEKKLPAEMAGKARNAFPSFIPKTDEENYQRIADLESLTDTNGWYATLKYDGTSCTAWNDEQGLHVCSRNLELEEFDESGNSNLYWKVARQYRLDNLASGYALQFEIVGPGIQGNPHGLAGHRGVAFTVHHIGSRQRAHLGALIHACTLVDMPMAQIVFSGRGRLTRQEVASMVELVAARNADSPIEGLVFRDLDNTWSFKALNLDYKD